MSQQAWDAANAAYDDSRKAPLKLENRTQQNFKSPNRQIANISAEPTANGPTTIANHYCWCGAWGSHGFGVSVRHGTGEWYCAEHC